MQRSCDVLIVGAGFAGLSAARALTAAGVEVRVLEARNRVGGRAKPATLAGVTVDAGGQWLGARHARLAALAQEYGVRAVPQHDAGRRVLESDGAVRSYRGLLPALPLPALVETGLSLWRLNRMARTLPAGQPWTAPRAAEWDAATFEDWKRKHVHTRGARATLDIATRAILCAEPAELSLLYFLDYVRASGSLQYLAEATGGAQAFLFDGGMHQLAVRMARDLADRVELDAPVRRVQEDADGIVVTAARGAWRARRVIVAASPALLERIDFEPGLPAARAGLHGAVKMGSVIKVHVAYARPFWRAQDFCGEAISDSADFCPVFDGSPADARLGILTGFFDGAPARRWHGRPRSERRAYVLDCLVRWFGPEAAHPVDYLDQDWREEEWSGGCYTAVMPPRVLTAYGAALRQPCGRVHWAGTETATEGTGYFEGALQSGARAAGEALAALRGQPGLLRAPGGAREV